MRLSKVVEVVLEEGLSSTAGRAVLGIGALFFAPLVFPQLRPVARGVVRFGIGTSHRVRELLAEAKENWSDLAAEVNAEIVAENNHAVTAPTKAKAQAAAHPRRATRKRAKS